ncbi:hypothetical protein LXA43DRAFT_1104327 [Ganoderma leucocontextum]|nr:hypothetical protein LXA43DRAFT_1104327 [Ganoderma leucocontextum]
MGRRRSPAQKAQLNAINARHHRNQENIPPEPPLPLPPPPEVPPLKKKQHHGAERAKAQEHAKEECHKDQQLKAIQGKLHNTQRRENRVRKKKEMLEERLMQGQAQMDEVKAKLVDARGVNDELQEALIDARKREEEARAVAHHAALSERQATDHARALQAHVFAVEHHMHHTAEQVADMKRSTVDEWRRAAHEVHQIKEQSIQLIRATEERCTVLLSATEREHAEELRQVREQCAAYLAARMGELEGRTATLLSSIQEQAVADVRAVRGEQPKILTRSARKPMLSFVQ